MVLKSSLEPANNIFATIGLHSARSNIPSLSSSKSIKSPIPSLSVSVHALIDETRAKFE